MREQTGDRLPVVGGGERGGQVLKDRSGLQAAALADRGDAFDPATAVIGLSIELDPAHDHRVTQRALGRVICRIYRIGEAEGPQRGVLLQQAAREPLAALMSAAAEVHQQTADRDAQRVQARLQVLQIGAVVQVTVVDGDDLARTGQELLAEAPGRAGALGDLAQLANDVRPAQLLLKDIKPVIAGIPVADDQPTEVLADQRLARLLAARGSIR